MARNTSIENQKEINEQVVLHPEQVKHVKKQERILRKHGVGHDSSKQGSGKSFFLMNHAQTWIRTLKLERSTNGTPELMIIVPPISLLMWKQLCEKYNINAVVQSYTEIRDGKTPYLAREGKNYTVTENFRQLVRDGVILGVDEIHHVSGNSMQAKACIHLTRCVAEMRAADSSIFSCVSLISNTPKGEKNGIPGFLKLTGIMKAGKLLHPRMKGRRAWWGFQELYDWCMGVDSEKTASLINRYLTINSSNVLKWTLKLYDNVLIPEIATNVFAMFDNSEVVYTIEKLDRNKFKDVASNIMSVEKALAIYDKGEKLPPVGGINLNPTFKAFDREKARSMVTRYKKHLETQQCKIALYVRYRETVKFLKEAFEDYNPLVLTGEKSSSKNKRNADRELIRERFQQPNGDYRVLIAHPKVGGESLSFDDQYGDWPRFVCVASSYHTTENKQIIGRFDRKSTKSRTRVEFLSFDGFQEEDNVYKRNQEKEQISEIIKGAKGSETLLFQNRTILGETPYICV